jgi:mono/diheme cytochrome c family protein
MRVAASALFVLLGVVLVTPASAQDKVEKGKQIYAAQKCSMCHSIAGQGNKNGSLDDVGSKLSDAEIRDWLVNTKAMYDKSKATRKPAMPAYAKLTADEVDNLIAYLKTLKKK